jgi:predicted phage terminase large subunit-like protein
MPPAPQPPAFIDLDYRPPGKVLAAFRASDAFARCLIGPMYAGRRTACIYDIVLRSICHPFQHYWRWAVIRATLDELETYTLPAWLKRIPPHHGKFEPKAPIPRHLLGFGAGQHEVGRLEVLFLGLDQAAHRRRLNTMELSGAWLDGARDLPEAVFEDALAQVGQYPTQLEGGCHWSGVMLSSRPPEEDHWIPAYFDPPEGEERQQGFELFRQPSGRSAEAENLANLPKGLYQRSARGKPESWIRTEIDGEYGRAGGLDPAVAAELDEKRERAEGSLLEFVRMFWRIVEPKRDFVEGWALEAMCEHLTAVTAGEINRLLMNVPPGFMKSLLTDVFWPAWEWGPQNEPTMRYLAFSYSSGLTRRDNGRFRSIVTSPEYRALWGRRFDLTGLSVIKVENDRTGWKLATSVGGIGTGERGDRVLIDDPNNVKKAESKRVLEETNQWLTEVMPDRLNDQAESAIVLIQQRTNAKDCTGTLLDTAPGEYVHLCIPMEFDAKRVYTTAIGWSDPRKTDGELAWEERFPREEVEKLRRIKGAFAYSGQYQQSPAPRGGGIIKRAEWKLWPPQGEDFDENGKPLKPLEYPPLDYILASLDTALTESEENDWSALTIWGAWRDENEVPKLLLMEAWQTRLGFYPLLQKIIKTCRKRKVDRLLIEAKANGISVAQEILRLCGGEEFGVELADPRKMGGDKVARAYAVQHLFENGLVYAPDREWAEMVIGECEVFPRGAHDDLVDTVTQALWYLRKSGIALLAEERQSDLRQSRLPPAERQSAPIYDV